jgi:putative transposase
MRERRACRLIKVDRKTVRYRSRRPQDDALRGRLRELAAEQRRFGYRRLHILLRAEGHVLNRKRTQRLYREEGLTVRKRKGRKRATGMRRSWSRLGRTPAGRSTSSTTTSPAVGASASST